MNIYIETNQRCVKRVPLDFAWPVAKEWTGHQNPYLRDQVACNDCNGTGLTVARLRLVDLASHLLNSTDVHNTHDKIPGKDMLQLTEGLAGRAARSGIGHDSLDCNAAVRKIIAAAGLPHNWGYCPTCNGDGVVFANIYDKKRSDEWVPEQPPVGGGYQLWSSGIPGHPRTPVFDTPEKLASYLSGDSTKHEPHLSYGDWLKVINSQLFIK